MAASQERTVQGTQQLPILSRTNTGNQSIRGGLPLQPIGSQSVASSHSHVPAASQNVGLNSLGQENTSLHLQPSQQQPAQSEELASPNYSTSLSSHFGSSQKPYPMSHSTEERELQRRIDEVKRKQAEFEESQKKQEELHSPQQQTYHQQSQHPRSQLHPSMLRLDNLIINGPNVSMR